MIDTSLRISMTVEASPREVFDAINDVRGWWSGQIEGETHRLGGEFTYRHEDLHRSTQRITTLTPGERVVWHVVDSHLSFVHDPAEWLDTDIIFDLRPVGDGTELTFTHAGLRREVACYDACSNAWNFSIATSLRARITSGAGGLTGE